MVQRTLCSSEGSALSRLQPDPSGFIPCWSNTEVCVPTWFCLEVQLMSPSTTEQYEQQQIVLRQLGDDLQKGTPDPNGKC